MKIDFSHNLKSSIAIKYAEFNWFLLGTFISRTGEWFDRVALNWFILTTTGSAFYIGVLEFCRLIPTLIFSLVGGILADKWERRKILIYTYLGSMVLTFLIGFVILYEQPFILLVFLVFCRGVLLAIELPTRNAILPNLVGKAALSSGLSIFTAVINSARVIGPAIAGYLLTILSAPFLLFLNALSFIAIIVTLFKIEGQGKSDQSKSLVKNKQPISEAFRFLRKHEFLGSVFLLGLIPMFFGYPYTTLVPSFANTILNMGPEGFGILLTSAAAGAIVCSLIIGWGEFPFTKGMGLLLFACLFGVSLFVFAYTNQFYWSIGLMFMVGLTGQGFSIFQRIIIQESVPDFLRGRILSLFFIDTALVPIGSLLLGALSEATTVNNALKLTGIICCLGTLVVSFYKRNIPFIK